MQPRNQNPAETQAANLNALLGSVDNANRVQLANQLSNYINDNANQDLFFLTMLNHMLTNSAHAGRPFDMTETPAELKEKRKEKINNSLETLFTNAPNSPTLPEFSFDNQTLAFYQDKIKDITKALEDEVDGFINHVNANQAQVSDQQRAEIKRLLSAGFAFQMGATYHANNRTSNLENANLTNVFLQRLSNHLNSPPEEIQSEIKLSLMKNIKFPGSKLNGPRNDLMNYLNGKEKNLIPLQSEKGNKGEIELFLDSLLKFTDFKLLPTSDKQEILVALKAEMLENASKRTDGKSVEISKIIEAEFNAVLRNNPSLNMAPTSSQEQKVSPQAENSNVQPKAPEPRTSIREQLREKQQQLFSRWGTLKASVSSTLSRPRANPSQPTQKPSIEAKMDEFIKQINNREAVIVLKIEMLHLLSDKANGAKNTEKLIAMYNNNPNVRNALDDNFWLKAASFSPQNAKLIVDAKTTNPNESLFKHDDKLWEAVDLSMKKPSTTTRMKDALREVKESVEETFTRPGRR